MGKRIGILRRIWLAWVGVKFVGYRRDPGWLRALPIYRARCPEHGEYEGHLRGRGYLRCPKGWGGSKPGCLFEVYVGEGDRA